ncbi:MAG: hypothetical protein J2P31_21440 [Blastocatellia bacterium]|nr:hypothetical protein [Blastocatellia bacterium]
MNIFRKREDREAPISTVGKGARAALFGGRAQTTKADICTQAARRLVVSLKSSSASR